MIHKNREEIPEAVTAARSLVDFAAQRGWSFVVTPVQRDMAGDPFFSVELGTEDGERFRICWHTRATGGKSYRLFSKTHRAAGRAVWTDAPSLKKIREIIQDKHDQQGVSDAPEEPGL